MFCGMNRCMIAVVAAIIAACATGSNGEDHDPAGRDVEQRAVRWLSTEVPRWKAENRCCSCHNNGDGARALLEARTAGHSVPTAALRDTLDWLANPDRWTSQSHEQATDETLAVLQFSFALLAAHRGGWIEDRTVLVRAADRVAAAQSSDGTWRVQGAGTVGSPITYGLPLATAIASRVLSDVDSERYRQQIREAQSWLASQRPQNVASAAAILWGCQPESLSAAMRQACWQVIADGEAPGGGWGPFVNSAPEPFDTALVLLAIARQPPSPQRDAMIRRGRQFLARSQQQDGSWAATTRPPGADSYAQQVSTTAWATMALVATRPQPVNRP